MAITRLSNSGIATGGVLKYDSALAGYPPVMAAPTATDAGTGTSVSVAFTAVSGATSYTAISTPGSFTATGASSPLTVTGLSSGTAYTFQVSATNAVGTGAYSAASNSVTPAVPPAFESIATANGTGGSATIDFTSIPQTYQHLQFRIFGVASGGDVQITMNGSAFAYSHYLTGNGSSLAANTNTTGYINWSSQPDTATGYVAIINILDYASTTKKKTIKFISGRRNTSGGEINVASALWNSTNAITSFRFQNSASNWTSNAQFCLYGIKGA